MSIETVQPEPATPAPIPASTSLGTLLIRFVGLLFVAVAALALIWIR